MKKFLIAGMLMIPSLANSQQALRKCELDFGVDVVTVSSHTATQVFKSSGTSPARRQQDVVLGIDPDTTDTSFKVYLTSFSVHHSSATHGWVVHGGSKEYFDWGPNVPVYAWLGADVDTAKVRFFSCR